MYTMIYPIQGTFCTTAYQNVANFQMTINKSNCKWNKNKIEYILSNMNLHFVYTKQLLSVLGVPLHEHEYLFQYARLS